MGSIQSPVFSNQSNQDKLDNFTSATNNNNQNINLAASLGTKLTRPKIELTAQELKHKAVLNENERKQQFTNFFKKVDGILTGASKYVNYLEGKKKYDLFPRRSTFVAKNPNNHIKKDL